MQVMLRWTREGSSFVVPLRDAAGAIVPSNLVVPGGPRTPHEEKYIDKILHRWGPALQAGGKVEGACEYGRYEVSVWRS